MSRIVGGDFIFGAKEKEWFVRQMWRLADFLGMDILDYTVLSNPSSNTARTSGKSENQGPGHSRV